MDENTQGVMTLEELSEHEAFEREEGERIEVTRDGRNLGWLRMAFDVEAQRRKQSKLEKKWKVDHGKNPRFWDFDANGTDKDKEAQEMLVRRSWCGTFVKEFGGFMTKDGPLQARTESGELHEENLFKLLDHRTVRAAALAFIANRGEINKTDSEKLAQD